MTSIPGSINNNRSFSGRALADLPFARIAGLAVVLVFSAAIVFGWREIERLGLYGYPAVFLVSLLANAAFLLPAPGFAVVFAAGGALDPVAVGLLAGLGAALGELTGYLVGLSGQSVLDDRPIYWRIERWMRKSGTLVIFGLAAVPNPFFDVGGVIAGALRMPAWRFVFVAWLGKSLRYVLLAYVGALAA
jgi:membrane protein YqaA with SNARE-associated domain